MPSLTRLPASFPPTTHHSDLKAFYGKERSNQAKSMYVFRRVTSHNDRRLIRYDDVGRDITIDMLPDEVLLDIFGFYVGEAQNVHGEALKVRAWQLLVHVSRRWRIIVFGSQHRLDLRLVWTPLKPVSDTLEVWPALPLVIRGWLDPPNHADNLIALLGHSDRVCEIDLTTTNCDLKPILTAMNVPFPQLTHLRHESYSSILEPVVPDSFLSGSAPHLRSIAFRSLPFPGLPKLLPSVARLVTLHLTNISQSGYFSPEALVTGLSTLTSLEDLRLRFQAYVSVPQYPPPVTRSVLPTLTSFEFKGRSEYSEYFVARIDAPRLNNLKIIYLYQRDFDASQLVRFYNRIPMFTVPKEVHLVYINAACQTDLGSVTRFSLVPTTGNGQFYVEIVSAHMTRQFSPLLRLCTSFSRIISTPELLYIYERGLSFTQEQYQEDDIENMEWLAILCQFIAVNELHLSKSFASRIAPALQTLVRERVTEVLPSLQNIFLEVTPIPGGIQHFFALFASRIVPTLQMLVGERVTGVLPFLQYIYLEGTPVPGGIRHFFALRRRSSHPIAISRWNEASKLMKW